MSATATSLAAPVRAAAPAQSEALDLRKLFAFIFMVFGMFMAILDIQIVSASLSEIQAGLSASSDEITWVQTAYLIAEVIMIPLSGFLSRAFSTRYAKDVPIQATLYGDPACPWGYSANPQLSVLRWRYRDQRGPRDTARRGVAGYRSDRCASGGRAA